MIQDDIYRHYEQNSGKVPTQITLVIDLEGFSLGNQSRSTMGSPEGSCPRYIYNQFHY